MFKKQKQQQTRKGNNRWADDDNDTNNQQPPKNFGNNLNFSKRNNNTPSFIKSSNYSNSSSSSNYNYNQQRNNYQSSNNTSIPRDTRFALEKKLIDDILQPTGIKIKPDEKLMVDFCRRAKNLDRTLIYNYLMEKISPFKTYVGNNELMLEIMIKLIL